MQAIVLSGGWNRQFSDVDSYDVVFKMKDLLLKHGFLNDNIEVFLANGEKREKNDKKENDDKEKSAIKQGRYTFHDDHIFTALPARNLFAI